jgi:type I restriction enzyme S subunit
MRDIKLPDGWKIGKLENLVSFTRGSEPGSDSYTEDDSYTRFLRVSDISGTSKKKVYTVADNLKLVNKGDLLLTLDGTPGIVSDQFEGAISSGIRKIDIANSKLLQDYLKFYLKSDNVQRIIYKYATGATILHASKSIHYIDVVLPSLETQKKIVQVLEKTKSAIEKKKEAIKLLDELVKSRFIGMFGDPKINPNNWTLMELRELVEFPPQNGLYKPTSEYVNDNSGVPILRIDAFYDGKVTGFLQLKRLKCADTEIERYLLKDQDIVINRVNSIEYLGKCALIEGLQENTVFESNMMRFHLKENIMNACFATRLLCSKYVYEQIVSCAKKAVNQASINQKDVLSFKLYVPPIELQNKFADFAKQIDKLKFVNNWNHRYLL